MPRPEPKWKQQFRAEVAAIDSLTQLLDLTLTAAYDAGSDRADDREPWKVAVAEHALRTWLYRRNLIPEKAFESPVFGVPR